MSIKSYVSATLEPSLTSYGLTPTTLNVVSDSGAPSGAPITIPLSDGPAPSSFADNPSTALSAEVATARTLYLLDRFGVSGQFYHELAQVHVKINCLCTRPYVRRVIIFRIQLHPEIPRLHHVKGLRQSLNSDIETLQLPPPYIGNYMHFRQILTKTLDSLER